jgi:hypothetical protein
MGRDLEHQVPHLPAIIAVSGKPLLPTVNDHRPYNDGFGSSIPRKFNRDPRFEALFQKRLEQREDSDITRSRLRAYTRG